jgi:hypothetical protein
MGACEFQSRRQLQFKISKARLANAKWSSVAWRNRIRSQFFLNDSSFSFLPEYVSSRPLTRRQGLWAVQPAQVRRISRRNIGRLCETVLEWTWPGLRMMKRSPT